MKRFLMTTAAILAVGAAHAAQTPVQKIDVETDLSAIKNPAAAAFFADLDTDLEADIAARLAPERLVSEGGSSIHVDIDALELASTWANLNDISQSKLTGTVSISSQTDNSKYDHYTLTVSYPEIVALLPAGTDLASLTTDSELYYGAMVDSFAEHVVEHLK